MDGIIALISFGFLFLFFVGMIKPGLFSFMFKPQATRAKVGLVFGGLFMAGFVLFSIISPNQPTPTPQKQEQPATVISDEVNLPILLGKKWPEMKPTISKWCGEEAVSKADQSPIHLLNCTIDKKYNFAFEFDDKGNVTDNNEFVFIGHTQYGDTEATVLDAAGVDKNSTSYKTSVKTDSTGQIIVKISL